MKNRSFKIEALINLISLLLWITQLAETDASYICYVFVFGLSVACFNISNKRGTIKFNELYSTRSNRIVFLFSAFFSCAVLLANYPLLRMKLEFIDVSIYNLIWSVFLIIMFLIGGFFAFWNILFYLSYNIQNACWPTKDKMINPIRIFFISFLLLVITRMLVLILCQYPGELTNDSISQMIQLMLTRYNNHHPFYHTLTIKFFVLIGLRLFKDINAAVCLYMIFQIVFMAAIFSYALYTMAQINIPRFLINSTLLFYVFMPYHIIYPITMWKDVMFGGFVLSFIVSVYRFQEKIGHRLANIIILLLSCLGFCLFRSNGLFAFALLTVMSIVLWKKRNKALVYGFLLVIFFCFILKHPILERLEVVQPDTIEMLSIPSQQIARVVKDGGELSEWEKNTLDDIIEIDKINDEYNPHISDPIKNLVRKKDHQMMITDNIISFIRLYASLGIKHPLLYLEAWIDETEGFWNAGYNYWCWDLGVHSNELGIFRTVRCDWINSLLLAYLWLFDNLSLLRLFMSIGLFVWTDMVILMISLIKKDKTAVFCSLPILCIVISLIISTPIFAEFRYIYGAFCSIPMVLAAGFKSVCNT